MNSEILTSVDDETKLRIVAGLLCEGKVTRVPAPYPHASQTPPPSSPRKPRVGDERGSWTS
jgi:hypothetical protein